MGALELEYLGVNRIRKYGNIGKFGASESMRHSEQSTNRLFREAMNLSL